MLYEISKEIAAELQLKKCPYAVVYGPERLPVSMTTPRIVIERDRQSPEQISAPKSRTVNPIMMLTRAIAGQIRVFAKSSVSGANVYNHERECDKAVDRVTVALHKVARRRCTEYRITRAKLLNTTELQYEGLESWPGVVYQINFEIDRGVLDTDWTGDGADTAEIGGTGGVTIGASVSVSGSATGNNVLPNADTEIE